MTLTPPLGYFGSKIRIASRITDLLPPHRGYVEPYCGSLAVLLAKPPVPFEVVNDLDGHLMTFWRVLRDQPEELARACVLTPHSRDEFQASWPIPADVSDLERARRVWIRLTQGRTHRLAATGWRYTENTATGSTALTVKNAAARIPDVAERLAKVTLENLPAVEVIDRYGRDPKTLLYVDPPYLADTRPDSAAAYRLEMSDPHSHREMAEALHNCKGPVVISGYAHPLYDDDLFPDWSRVEIAASVNGQGTGPADRTEVLWSNRPLGDLDLLGLLDGGAA